MAGYLRTAWHKNTIPSPLNKNYFFSFFTVQLEELFPKVTEDLEPLSYMGALLITLQMLLYKLTPFPECGGTGFK
jgi:hypothetical protein